MLFRVKGAIIIGILLVSIISWPRSTTVTYFPHTPAGDDAFNFFKQVATFRPIKHTLNVINFDISAHGGKFGLAFITFLYVGECDSASAHIPQVADMQTFLTRLALFTPWPVTVAS